MRFHCYNNIFELERLSEISNAVIDESARSVVRTSRFGGHPKTKTVPSLYLSEVDRAWRKEWCKTQNLGKFGSVLSICLGNRK